MSRCSHTMRVKGRDGITRCGDCGKRLPDRKTGHIHPGIKQPDASPVPADREGGR